MSDVKNTPPPSGPCLPEDFDQCVERCLAMVLHHREMQELAEIVKRVHAERSQETKQ